MITATQTDAAGNRSAPSSPGITIAVNTSATAVIGSTTSADTIDNTASSTGYTYYGQGGDDVIRAGGGADTFVEFSTAGAGADRYYGGAGNDTAQLGAADSRNDFFDGEAGFDTVDYNRGVTVIASLTVAINETAGALAGTIVGANIGTDTVNNVESYVLSAGDDTVTIVNSTIGVTVQAMGGNDDITLGGGADTVYDNTFANSGTDTVNLGAGNDTLYAGGDGGTDTYVGGAGTDLIDYASAAAALTIAVTGEANIGGSQTVSATVTFDMRTNSTSAHTITVTGIGAATVVGSDIGTDTLTGVERILGGADADLFILQVNYTSFVNAAGLPSSFGYFSGGGGTGDVLRLTGGLGLDFSVAGVDVNDVATLDMLTDTAANLLNINPTDARLMGVLNAASDGDGTWTGALLAPDREQLIVKGNTNDTVNDPATGANGWSLVGTAGDGVSIYNVYNSSTHNTQLLIDTRIQQAGVLA